MTDGAVGWPVVIAADELRPMRRDAVRNQRAVLDAAREVLAEYGTDASIELIASRAGVGVGTVYRHFPNKDALVDALVRSIVSDLVAAATTALERGDGLGFEEFVRAVGESLAGHRGYAQMLVGSIRAEGAAEQLRRLIAKLVKQAKSAGQLAPWVTVGDAQAMIWAIRGVIDTAGTVAPTAWKRQLDLYLHVLRTPVAVSTQPALTGEQLDQIAAQPLVSG